MNPKVYMVGPTKYIHSFELYSQIGLVPNKYSRWVRRWVEKGQKDVEYFNTIIYPLNFRKGAGKPRYQDYLLSISFASTLCFNTDTEESAKIRLWLFSL